MVDKGGVGFYKEPSLCGAPVIEDDCRDIEDNLDDYVNYNVDYYMVVSFINEPR